MIELLQIQISRGLEFPHESELLSILERLLPIKFFANGQNLSDIHGLIDSAIGDQGNIVVTCPHLSVPNFSHLPDDLLEIETEVMFADDIRVPFPFRGRKLRTRLSQNAALTVGNSEKVLASSDQGPIWTVSENDGAKCFRSALPLPYVSTEQNFNDIFNGERFLEMLILLEFIRIINPTAVHGNAPLRASFIIDDPNLHWPRYGFFGYREMVDQAKAENFHLSFATIPLDTWYTHSTTADIFRKNSERISLLVHGNNHAKGELAVNYTNEARSELLKQAIARITHLEKKSGVPVSRVMVPPHGACSNEMLREMPLHGFESACISSGSLRHHNPGQPWVKTLGFFPSELIEGCPVLPRWGLTGNVENTLLIAAYLGQPMVLRGHHQDLKNGGGEFIKFARFINSLGDVFWGNMTDLSRLNYQWRMDGNKAVIRPLGQNIVFKLPEHVNAVVIDPPNGIEVDNWAIKTANSVVHAIRSGETFQIASDKVDEIFIGRNTSQQPNKKSAAIKPTSPKLILRRLLTEARDRLLLSD